MSPTILDLPLEDILADDRLQMRIKINKEHVADIAEALADGNELQADHLPVVYHCNTAYWLADGFHRLEAHKKAERPTMRCEVRQGEFRDALMYALGANQHTSLKRTNADKRKAVEKALSDEEIRQHSDNQLADLCGVSRVFIGNVRQESSGCNGYILTKRRGKDGKTYERRAAKKIANADGPPTTDPFGRPLPENLVQAFVERAYVPDLVERIKTLKGEIRSLCERPGGVFVSWNQVETSLTSIGLMIENTMPEAVCPECAGSGKGDEGRCPTCLGTGFVYAERFKGLPVKMQEEARRYQAS